MWPMKIKSVCQRHTCPVLIIMALFLVSGIWKGPRPYQQTGEETAMQVHTGWLAYQMIFHYFCNMHILEDILLSEKKKRPCIKKTNTPWPHRGSQTKRSISQQLRTGRKLPEAKGEGNRSVYLKGILFHPDRMKFLNIYCTSWWL